MRGIREKKTQNMKRQVKPRGIKNGNGKVCFCLMALESKEWTSLSIFFVFYLQ